MIEDAAWFGLVVLLAMMALRLVHRTVRRYTDGPLLEPRYYAHPDDPGVLRAYWRHPMHKRRCACRRYGVPESPGDAVRDEDGYHERDRCYPASERLEDRA